MKIDIEGVDLVCVRALGRFRARPDLVSLESDKTRFANVAHRFEEGESGLFGEELPAAWRSKRGVL